MAEQVGDALESAAEQMGEIAAKRVRRPWLWFFGGSLCLVSLVTAGGPMLTLVSPHPARARTVPLRQLSVAALRDGVGHGQAGVKKMAMPLAVDGRLASSLDSYHKQENHPQKLPSEKPKPGPTLKLESARTVDAPGAADPGGAPRVPERSALIQGMIEAGFSRAQAIEAIAAVNASKSADIPKAISWQLQRDADENLNEWKSERVVLSFDHMDFDGYALLWGNVNKAPSLQASVALTHCVQLAVCLKSAVGAPCLSLACVTCRPVLAGVRRAMSQMEAGWTVQLSVQHLRLLPARKVLCTGAAPARFDGWSVLAQTSG
eukprot:6206887-Pleurochrysis_carterae.AAC.2